MRILVVHPGAHFSVADVYTGWVEAFREQGHQVQPFNLGDLLTYYDSMFLHTGVKNHQGMEQFKKGMTAEQAVWASVDRMLATIWKFGPQVIFIVSCFFIPNDLLDVFKRRGYKVVILHTESPYEDGKQLERACRVDISLINDPTNLESFRKASRFAEYLPHAYRPDIHKPGPSIPQLENDFCFVGTGYDSRIKFFEAMDFKDLDVFLAGNWTPLTPASKLFGYLAHDKDECLDNEQTVQVYRSSKMGINFYRREIDADDKYASQKGWALGPREVEMAATGLFFLRDPRGESDEVFPMLPSFTSPEDATEKMHWWLAHPEKMAGRAAQAREAIADRTFGNHGKKVLELLEKL